jgi:predicted Rossmann-fold nucleotide-binding protein
VLEPPFDSSPREIESRTELELNLAAGSLAGLTVQGLRLDTAPIPDLSSVDVTGTLFVGCRFASRDVEAELVRRGAYLLPPFDSLPYSIQPPYLYTPEDLAAGFASGGFAGMYDNVIYQHFRAAGAAVPEVREALAQRLHDHGIDNALADVTRTWVDAHGPASVVGVMGGHAVPRGAPAYRMAARLGWELARADRLVVTGGGPGVMEAANLGAYLANRTADELDAALDLLATAPDVTDRDRYTEVALQVRSRFAPAPLHRPAKVPAARQAAPPAAQQEARPAARPAPGSPGAAGAPLSWARLGGLSIPTWLYGHEPVNLFAAQIAKYFSNAIREDIILRLARGGIVFAPGQAGTVQEVFQAATKTFYGTDGASGPYVFLDTAFWTRTLPVADLLRPLLARSPAGDLSGSVHVTDDAREAARLLTDAARR